MTDTDNVKNGHLVDVEWPDFKGRVGFQPHGNRPTCSYRGSGEEPKIGDTRALGEHGSFRVTKVLKNPFVSGMRTLELEKIG